jgi:hypothetical protein
VQPVPFEKTKTVAITPSVTKVIAQRTVSYTGKDGVDALTLLQQKTAVKQDASGLVTTINGYTANNKQHEYWSFYVNGKMADVGPKEYMTKSSDQIEWRIEKY